MESILKSETRRTSKLGDIGETLAAEALAANGFTGVVNLNETRRNHPFADLLASQGGTRYLIGVKTRNERRDIGLLNESYNCILVADAANKRLKAQGRTVEEITDLAFSNVADIARIYDSVPAWIAVPVRPLEGTYSVYFGLLSDLGARRSIPMTPAARARYRCLASDVWDVRITPELPNQRRGA